MKSKKVIKKEIVIVGAGASGLMFSALNPDLNFALVEANSKVGQKIKVSGGGRCNITNQHISEKNYFGDEAFVKEVISEFSYKELLEFFEGIEFEKRKGSQFFCKKSSQEVINFFIDRIDSKKIFLNHKVMDVEYKDDSFIVISDKATFICKKLVVASGGLSFKELGASGIAFKIAQKFGHTVTKTKPALVGWTLQRDDFWMKNLSGISLKANIKVADKEFFCDLLFAHRGISGPVVLNSSLYWEKGSVMIDFLPDMELKFKHKQKQISSNLPLPKRFVKEFLKKLNIEDKVISKLTSEEKKKLNILRNYQLSPAGDFGYKKAEVTKGGIKTDEVDSKTMQSRLQKNLYFLGECLDVTGELGGYNFHFAFSSARKLALK